MHWSERIIRDTIKNRTGRELERWDGGDTDSALSEASGWCSGEQGYSSLKSSVLAELYAESYNH